MKNRLFLTIVLSLLVFLTAKSQTNWFTRNVTISQSLATSEQEELPAQFTITMPKDKSTSYLINLGIGINPHFKGMKNVISAFTGEYHRNSLTDDEQHNIQLGFKGDYQFAKSTNGNTAYQLIFDPQFARDLVEEKSSLQSNLLFTWTSTNKKVNFGGTPNYDKNKRVSTKLSFIMGTQVQNVLDSDKDETKRGFKLRPLATVDFGFYLLNKKDYLDPKLGFTAGFTQRYAAVNTTSDSEKYSHLFRTGVDYYFMSDPAKLSIGAAFVTGSDPYTALKQQQYFLLSFNVFLSN
ncbi:hypothetical protein ACHMWN_12135 [Pedobacter sp. UC225_61]|uniref:hypothetical protein n=1 Tax=Pedobacter sp. UC225_61 TaxID=3374623 RepID=UPI0037A40467